MPSRLVQSRIVRGITGGISRRVITRALTATGLLGVLIGAGLSMMPVPTATAAAGINKAINFQGKLTNTDGTNIPDGIYNMEFKLYTAGGGCVSGGTSPCGGTLQSTETWLRNNSQGVTVSDGIFQVNLGTITSLPAIFNNDTIWLSINLGNTNATCTDMTSGQCHGDGEMLPFVRFTAAPYALNSDQLGGISAAGFAQINPGSAQAGSLNIGTNVQAGSALQAPLVDTATGVGLSIGTGTATSVTVGRALSTTNLTLQGSASTSWSATGASGTTTVSFTAPTTTNAISFPNAGGTICTTVATTCSATYQAAGNYLLKNATDSSSIAGLAAAGFGYTFTNTTSAATTSGILKLDNGSNTGATLLVTANATPTAGAAVLKVNQANAAATGNLIDLQLNGTSQLAVDYAGNVTQTGGTSTTDTINGQRISAAANFTGTVTAATSFLAPLFDTPSGTTTLNVGTNNATVGIALNQATTVASNKLFTANGASIFQPATDSATAFQVKQSAGAGGATILDVDTSTQRVGIGTIAPTQRLHVAGTSSSTAITLKVQNTNGAPGAGTTESRLLLSTDPTISADNGGAALVAHRTGGSGNGSADLYFQTSDASVTPVLNTWLTLSSLGVATFAGNLTVTAGATSLTGLAAGSSTAAAVTTGAASNKGLTIKGASSQSANLLELQDNNGLINGFFNSSGNQLTLGRVASSGVVTQGKLVLSDGTTSNFGGTIQLAGTITAGGNITYTLPVSSTTQTICTTVASSCGGTTGAYVALQGSTPGTAQTGNINVSGTGVFGADLTLTQGANHTISAESRSTNAAGNLLTIQGSNGGSGASANVGGGITLQAGSAGGTGAANGGDITLISGARLGGGDAGHIILKSGTGDGTTDPFFQVQKSDGSRALAVYTGTGPGYLQVGGTVSNSAYDLTFSADNAFADRTVGVDDSDATDAFGDGKNLVIHAGSTSVTNANGGNVVLTGGNKNGTGTVGGVTVKNVADSANAFRVQNAAGTSTVFSVNTSASSVVTVGVAGSSQFTNNSSTYNTALALGDLATGNMGASAAATVDVYTAFTISPTASGRSYTVLSPTSTSAGRIIYVSNINATNSFTLVGNTSVLLNPGVTATLVWNGAAWTFAGTDASSLQAAYNNQVGSTTPSIVSTSTKSGVTIQNANTGGISAGSEIFGVHSPVSGDILTGTNSYLAVTSYGVGVNLASGVAATSGIDLQFGGNANRVIQVQAQQTAATAGANLTVQSATGNTSGAGGQLNLTGGTGGNAGAGGAVALTGGTSGGGATAGGAVTVQGGASNATAGSNGGAATLKGGNGTATGTGGVGGNVSVTAGSSFGSNANVGGTVSVQGGQGSPTGAGGAVTLQGGAGGTTSGNGGLATVQGGSATLAAGSVGGGVAITGGTAAPTAGSTGGVVTINGGAGTSTGTGAAGSAVNINGGAAGGSGANAGGNVVITGGISTSTGTGGTVSLVGGVASATAGSAGGAISIVAANGSNTGTGGNGGSVAITAGNGQGSGGTTNGGNITLTSGSAVGGTAGNISLVSPTINVGTAGSSTLTNNSSTINTALALGDLATGNMGASAAATVNVYTAFTISPTASGRSYTVLSPSPTTAGRIIYVSNINATNSFTLVGSSSVLMNPGVTATLVWNGSAWTFAGTDASGLQSAYNNSGATDPQIQLSNTNGGLKIRDAASSTIGNLLQVADSAGTTNYLTVTSAAASVGGNLLLTSAAARTIQIVDQATAATAGGNLTVKAAAGNTSGAGGNLALAGGAGGNAAAGGTASLTGGASGGGATAGGAVTVQGGASNATAGSNGGAANLLGANGSATGTGGVGGNVAITAGSSFGSNANVGGTVSVQGGQGSPTGAGGAVTLQGGAGGTTSGNGGLATVQGGTETLAAGSVGGGVLVQGGTAAPTAGSTGGVVTINGGAGTSTGTGAAGSAVNINGGAAGGSAANAGGAVTITGGTASGTGTGGTATLQGGAAAAVAGSAGGGVAITGATGSATGTGGVGGSVTITAGNAAGSGVNAGGNIRLTAGTATSTGVPGVVQIDQAVFTNQSTTFTQTANNQSFPGVGVPTAATFQGYVDGFSTISITMAGAFTGATVNVPAPTNTTAIGRILYISAPNGSISYTLASTNMKSVLMSANSTAVLVWNGTQWASSASATSLQDVYNNTSSSPAGIITTSATKNILFQAGTGFDNTNVFQIGNSTGATIFTVDTTNTATGTNLAVNGAGESALGAEWSAHGGAAISRDTTFYATGTGAVKVAATAANHGARNTFAAALAINTKYNVSFSIQYSGTAWANSDVAVEYYRTTTPTLDATCSSFTGTYVPTLSTNTWIKYNCSFTTSGTAGTSGQAFLAIRQTVSATRNFWIDNLNVSAQNATGTQDVGALRVGGALSQGLNLLTLDSYASAPFSGVNPTLLGSMYYDTTQGRIQCYEQDGWGPCGSAPNNSYIMVPEYTSAVLSVGTGADTHIGTMTANMCSGSSRFTIEPTEGTVCAATEEYNYYRWTSGQTSAQTYSIFVKYQLPPTFNNFLDDNTIQAVGRISSATDAALAFGVYGNTGTQCGSTTTIASSANTWTTTSLGGSGETSCGFVAGNIITFKIDMSSKNNAYVYMSNIMFTMSGK